MFICSAVVEFWCLLGPFSDEPAAFANEKPKEEVPCICAPSFKVSSEGTVKIAESKWALENKLKLPKPNDELEAIN